MMAAACKLQYRQFYQTWTTLCDEKSKKLHYNPVYLSAVTHRGFLQTADTSQLMLPAWIRSLGCYQLAQLAVKRSDWPILNVTDKSFVYSALEIVPCQLRLYTETSALRHHTAFKVHHGAVTSSYVFQCISWKCWIWRVRFECDGPKFFLIIKFVFYPLFPGWICEVKPIGFWKNTKTNKPKHSI